MEKENSQGFTLLELIIVIIIVGILASLALTRFSRLIERSRAVEAINMFRSLRVAVERCYLITAGANFCDCVPQGYPQAPASAWENLGMDDPSTVPNTHFVYTSAGCNFQSGFTLRATRNSLDGGSGTFPGTDYIDLDYSQQMGLVQVVGQGVYSGMQLK